MFFGLPHYLKSVSACKNIVCNHRTCNYIIGEWYLKESPPHRTDLSLSVHTINNKGGYLSKIIITQLCIYTKIQSGLSCAGLSL